MGIVQEIDKEVSEYVKPILKEIESVRIVPSDEIKDNKDKYPQGNFHKDQIYVTVEPAEGFDTMDLTPLYDQLPEKLSNKLCHLLYEERDGDGLMVVITISTYVYDRENQSINIDTPKLDDFGAILQKIKEDVDYLHPNNPNELIQILETNKETGVIKIHKDQFYPVKDRHAIPNEEKITRRYLGQSGVICDRIIGKEEDYYKIQVRYLSDDSSDMARNKQLFQNIKGELLKCEYCACESVVLSEDRSTIGHCTSCNHITNVLNEDTMPINYTIPELKNGRWTKGLKEDLSDITNEILDIKEMKLLNDKPKVKLKTITYFDNSTENVLYIQFNNNSPFWIPFEAGSKKIYTNSLEPQIEKGYCYSCGNELTQTEYNEVMNLGVQKNDNIYAQSGYFCGNCIGEYEEKVNTIIEENPKINSKLLSSNI